MDTVANSGILTLSSQSQATLAAERLLEDHADSWVNMP